MDIKWTTGGNLAVDFNGRTMITVFFYDEFHDHKLTNREKLKMLDIIILETKEKPELIENEPVQMNLPFD